VAFTATDTVGELRVSPSPNPNPRYMGWGGGGYIKYNHARARFNYPHAADLQGGRSE